MEKIEIRVKRLTGNQDIALPRYESEGSSGMDIRASVKEPVVLKPGEIRLIPTGLAVSIPSGFEGQIRPRSGLALKHGISMVNSPGTIDSGYRNEWMAIVVNLSNKEVTLKKGERICQIILSKMHEYEFDETNELPISERGQGGFGSTGKN